MGFSLRALLVGVLASAMLLNGAPWLDVSCCATDSSSDPGPFHSSLPAAPTETVMVSAPVRSDAAVPVDLAALEPDADDDVSTDSSACADFPILNRPRTTTQTFAPRGAASTAAVRLALLQRLTI